MPKAMSSPADPVLTQTAPLPPGVAHFPRLLDDDAQRALLEAVRAVIAAAPLYRPAMPRTGAPFSVAMTNCGRLGWVSDREGGYRYQASHPVTGRPWPAMPRMVEEIWEGVSGHPAPPQACLVNYYADKARLGLHRDADEEYFSAPVVSISLGDGARFLIGGTRRRDPVQSLTLASGDVIVLGGAARLAHHGVARIYRGSSDLLAEGGRFNLTLRRVTRSAA